jgi:hypothetical protein
MIEAARLLRLFFDQPGDSTVIAVHHSTLSKWLQLRPLFKTFKPSLLCLDSTWNSIITLTTSGTDGRKSGVQTIQPRTAGGAEVGVLTPC